jgi:molybdopterin/thiamine biosynthesis adenylyltransferase
MDDTQLLRYSRHILLSELGVDAQERFAASHALIVGIGGLGNPAAVGQPKVEAARARIRDVNPEVEVATVAERVGLPKLKRLAADADVVVDCSDNFATRHAVNRACVSARKPLVSGAAIRFDGQVAVFDARDRANPCYHCLFGEGDEFEETRCATMGVFAPLVGIIGATQAAESLKLLAGAGRSLAGRLLLLDALTMEWREVRVVKDPRCPVCGEGS